MHFRKGPHIRKVHPDSHSVLLLLSFLRRIDSSREEFAIPGRYFPKLIKESSTATGLTAYHGSILSDSLKAARILAITARQMSSRVRVNWRHPGHAGLAGTTNCGATSKIARSVPHAAIHARESVFREHALLLSLVPVY